jgi:hypothetical protein
MPHHAPIDHGDRRRHDQGALKRLGEATRAGPRQGRTGGRIRGSAAWHGGQDGDDSRARGCGSGRACRGGATADGAASGRGSAAGAGRASARRRGVLGAGPASRSPIASSRVRLTRNATPLNPANAASAGCQSPCPIIVPPSASAAKAPLTRRVLRGSFAVVSPIAMRSPASRARSSASGRGRRTGSGTA